MIKENKEKFNGAVSLLTIAGNSSFEGRGFSGGSIWIVRLQKH
jgi:hypothetical protein